MQKTETRGAPPPLNLRDLRDALNQAHAGEFRASALASAFGWTLSPQGHFFWESQYNALMDGQALSLEAEAILLGWLGQAIIPLTYQALGQSEPAQPTAPKQPEPTPQKIERGEPFPARALRFGRPQIMGGTGQWDNLRYCVDETGAAVADSERD